MKIDFKNPDSISNIRNLQELLQKQNPSIDEVAAAMLFAMPIFYSNRPGKLHGLLKHHSISGTGCHNPTSEKTKKTLWNIIRYEINIEDGNGSTLGIKHEYMQGGYLRAVFTTSTGHYVVSADIFGDEEHTVIIKSASIEGSNPDSCMKELAVFLKEPLDTLFAIVNSASTTAT